MDKLYHFKSLGSLARFERIQVTSHETTTYPSNNLGNNSSLSFENFIKGVCSDNGGRQQSHLPHVDLFSPGVGTASTAANSRGGTTLQSPLAKESIHLF